MCFIAAILGSLNLPIRFGLSLSRAAEDVIVVVVVMMLETTRTVMALDGGDDVSRLSVVACLQRLQGL